VKAALAIATKPQASTTADLERQSEIDFGTLKQSKCIFLGEASQDLETGLAPPDYLKQPLSDAVVREEFSAYRERLSRLLGISKLMSPQESVDQISSLRSLIHFTIAGSR